MTAAFLQSELASLIQDSKRRQSNVRTAAEKSLADLKAIQVTSETQLAGDLLRRLQFIDPFILACNSKHVKLAVTGAVCLQRLVASKAIPPSRLSDVLDAFREAAQQGFDVQLKILQAMPSLLQLYASELHGEALGKVLSLCAGLAGSKTALVSSTANATFQELITALLETQARTGPGGDDDDDASGQAYDVVNVFTDMCMVVGGEQPQFLGTSGLSAILALEAIELSLANPKISVLRIPSCLTACENFLIPGTVQILDKTVHFATFGRSLRILYLLAQGGNDRMLKALSQVLATILSIMDRPSGPAWRRVMCLEFMSNIASEFQLFRAMYYHFDCNEIQNRVVGSLMSILVRIAAEDPALIGLGRQSTIPTNSEDESSSTGGVHVDVDAVGSVLQASSSVTGISSKWSTMSTPILEQVDRQALPEIPETYIYTLVLGCVASLSDGLSRYIMPLSVPNRATLETAEIGDVDGVPTRRNSQARKAARYQRLMNPLKRDDILSKEEVETCAKLIEDCWPAVLATCSTFLNSALDSYFYHILVRTVQKLAQVSGVLELFTPRDALLTTLAKVSVPINASTLVGALHGFKLAKVSRDDENGDLDDASIKSPVVPTTPRLSVDVSRQPLNVRNLLCLRALLNLGIALGPTLSEASWFIIIQVLQQADALMSVNPATRNASTKSQTHEDLDVEGQTSLGSEITAVSTASKRMMESTRTYSDEMFEVLLNSIFKITEGLAPTPRMSVLGGDANGTKELRVISHQHKSSRSVSGAPASAPILQVEVEFVLKTIGDLARINLHRFCSTNSQSCTWNLVIAKLLAVIASSSVSPQLRLQATSVANAISVETARVLEKQNLNPEELNKLQRMCLETLHKQIHLLYKGIVAQSVLATDVDIHRRLLEALENIVSNSGESLTTGWRIVFEILQKTARQSSSNLNENFNSMHAADQELVLERTIPPAFRTVQLIVSDFLNTIDPQSFSVLVQLLPSFGTQNNDLNISLTTTVLFSNLSALLLERLDKVDLTADNVLKTGENSHPSTSERKAANISSLWFTIVLQLCTLCGDSRSDVRNSALRVLIRIYESASPQLNPTAWNVSFLEAFIPVVESYTGQQQDASAWHASYTQLLQGMVSLFVQNVEVIMESEGFSLMWKALIAVLDIKLEEQGLDGCKVVFSLASELLRALHTKRVSESDFIFPVLRMWVRYQPASIPIHEQSNQDAISTHATLFEAAMETGAASVTQFSIEGQTLVDLALSASKRAILAAVHPPYSSDVTKSSAEQTAVVKNLKIIRRLMDSRKREFGDFLLDLIGSILMRNAATEVEKQKIVTGSKSLKRPTLVAFMSQCITIFRDIVHTERTSKQFVYDTPTEDALVVLIKVVKTKHTNISSSNDSPVWKNATAGLVELAEAIEKCYANDEVLESLHQPYSNALEAITASTVSAERDPNGLLDIFSKDETFDIEHLRRFHRASVPLLLCRRWPPQDRKQYVTTLFQASLIAKPWFGDLPHDLVNDPLSTFSTLRPGSIRPPDFSPRAKMPYEALDTLFELVDVKSEHADNFDFMNIAQVAAPYVLLRIAHTIKVFLVDQRLRNLTPPPTPIQHELNVILNKGLRLRVVNQSYDPTDDLSLPPSGKGDGKVHLRILYPLILKLRDFWTALPKLKVCAWQDSEDGKGIQAALDSWSKLLGEMSHHWYWSKALGYQQPRKDSCFASEDSVGEIEANT